MAAIFNDGGVQYGSRTISIDSVTYIADSIEVTRTLDLIEVTDEVGDYRGCVPTVPAVTGSATLQMPSAATAPSLGDTFSATFTEGSETFIITEVGTPEEKGGDKKISISFRKRMNTPAS